MLAALVVLGTVTSFSFYLAPDSRDRVEVQLQREHTDAVDASAQLARIEVKGRAVKTGYARSRFGSGWASVHGCDVRNRTLSRDLLDVTYRPGTNRCVVTAGTLNDLYSGRTIRFVRGEHTSGEVAIDHRYPLALAWQQGAQGWPAQRRKEFANDLDNLVAVDGRTNKSKGASGPGSWLPPNKAYRCRYVIAFVGVTAEWGLSMNPGDYQMADRILDRC